MTFIIAASGGIPDVKTLAASEAAFLRSSTGAVPAVDVSGSSATDESSTAYQAGLVVGGAFFVGLVVFIVRNGKKRQDERQAYKARMATPPPVFPARDLLHETATDGEQVDAQLAADRSPDATLQ